jgi:hypothetical protein
MVNRKGLHPYMALNRVLVVAFSNERVAISIPSKTAAGLSCGPRPPSCPEAEAVSPVELVQHRGGFRGVAAYLHTRDVSAWNPNARPP